MIFSQSHNINWNKIVIEQYFNYRDLLRTKTGEIGKFTQCTFYNMRCLVMFITAVCLLFLLKLKWPKNKSVYDLENLCNVNSM